MTPEQVGKYTDALGELIEIQPREYAQGKNAMRDLILDRLTQYQNKK